MKVLLSSLAFGLGITLGAAAADPILIPFVTDPSPVMDGSLQEWTQRGALLALDRPEQVTYGANAWDGPRDLSGWVRLGYDTQNLYVAGHVVDDVFSQQTSGSAMWQGDHILAFVDFVRSGRKEDMIQFGLGPGNLKPAGTPGPDIKPDLVIWEPPGWDAAGATVAAKRTAEGYDLEAAIPFRLFRVEPVKFQTLALEIAFSDCDQMTPRQETLVSFGTARWNPNDPRRLLPAGLADRTGAFPADAFQEAAQRLADQVVIRPDETKEFRIDVTRIPEGRVPALTFKARVDHERCGGCCGPLLTKVNGKDITPTMIANRPPAVTFVSGGTQTSWYGAGVALWYAPSFEAVETSPYKPLDVVACEYTLRLDGLIVPGPNTLSLKNVIKHAPWNIVMADLAFSWSTPSRFRPARVYAPAPTGPLPVREPATTHAVACQVAALPGGAVRLAWGTRDLVIHSRFGTPGGAWAEWSAERATGWGETRPARGARPAFLEGRTGALGVRREVEVKAECVLIRDTLTNTSTDLLPVIVNHDAASGPYEALHLAGRPVPAKTGSTTAPENPSVVVLGKDSGFALVAYDDVFRLHFRGYCDERTAGLGDDSLVLRPGVAYRQEWLVFPLTAPDYWQYVNAARRFFDTNFTIPGSFCFLDLHPVDLRLLPWELADYLDRKNALLVSVGLGQSYKGLFPHGPNDRLMDPRRAAATIKTIGALRPQTKLLTYFNCFDCSRAPGDPIRWPDCRLVTPDGKQIFNGTSYPLYFPTLENEYGKEMDRSVDWLLNTVGADGLYWDCYDYAGVTHYGEPWDGWSADLDPATHAIVRKRSATPLISWPWRERLTARLLKEGRPLVANSNPCTTSEMQYHFPRFVETADITALCRAHLFTPIALGDHITERNEVDAYRWMLNALDWGGLYYWYSGRVVPTRPTLTAYMFPFTPVELHAGWLVGKERILTKVSGRFGWGDDAVFAAHVFDRVGRETDEVAVPRLVTDGKAYAEVRIPEGYAVAIVRTASGAAGVP